MDKLSQDIRYTLRTLRNSPGFTMTAALVIMLGTAAVTTIFSVVNALLVAPSPAIGNPATLVDIDVRRDHGQQSSNFSYPLYRDLAAGTSTFDGLAVSAMARGDVAADDRATAAHELRAAMIVSGNYFSVLQVRPAAGRFFVPQEDSVPLAHPVAVLGFSFAALRFGNPAAAIGRLLDVNGTRFTVVGVAPEGFGGTVALVKPDIFVPGMMTSVLRRGEKGLESNRNANWLQGFGRLKPGVSRAAAQTELNVLLQRIAKANDDAEAREIRLVRLTPIPVRGAGIVTAFMAVLMTVAGLVLLIASVNVGNMLLARGVARRKEFVVRLAVGATRGRLIRQLLTESVMLFFVGGTAGVVLTGWLVRIIERVHIDADFPLVFHFPIDVRVLSFTLIVTFITGLVFGLVPALAASRGDLALSLRGDGAGVGERREKSRNVFVVAQLAMSVLLLVSAGLFLRALDRASRVDPGFDYAHIISAPLSLTNAGYDSVTARPFMREVAARVAALPGVQAVTFASLAPLANNSARTRVTIPGHETPKGQRPPLAGFDIVGLGYFKTMRLPLLAGRTFDASDVRGAPASVVVTAQFVKQFWPGVSPQDALGRTFKIGEDTKTVVGVVGDGRFTSLTDALDPYVFFSDEQEAAHDEVLLVRTATDPGALGPDIQRIVLAVDPKLPPPRVQTLVSTSATGLLPQRVAALVTASLGALGLLLAAVGVYGVITYGVGRRTREIGVRMALGAQQRDVVGMVVREGWRFALLGLVIGLGIATLASRLLSRFLLGVSPLDPLTLLAVPTVLLSVTLLATWLPARRAASVDVARALREG